MKIDCEQLVEDVRNNKPGSLDRLYELMKKATNVAIRCCHANFENSVDDYMHDAYIIVWEKIRNKELNNPEKLFSFAIGILKNLSLSHYSVGQRDSTNAMKWHLSHKSPETPEGVMLEEEQTKVLGVVLKSLHPKEREILVRFYSQEETREKIMADMELSDGQFRNLKSRTIGKVVTKVSAKFSARKLLKVA